MNSWLKTWPRVSSIHWPLRYYHTLKTLRLARSPMMKEGAVTGNDQIETERVAERAQAES